MLKIKPDSPGGKMDGLYLIARMVAGFLGFTAITGVVWFAGSLGGAIIFAGLVLGITSLVAACVSERRLSIVLVRRVLVLLCIAGVGCGLILIAADFRGQPIEWGVIAINLLNVAALVSIASRAYKQPLGQ